MAKIQWAVIPEFCDHGVCIGNHVMPVEMLFEDSQQAQVYARSLTDVIVDEAGDPIALNQGHRARHDCVCEPQLIRENELPIYVHRMVQ